MKTINTILIGIGIWFLSNWAWNSVNGGGAGAGGSGTGAGGSGAGAGGSGSGAGAGGSGGSGGSGAGSGADYAALAAAIQALADGVQLPNIKTVARSVTAGTTELIAGIGGKRQFILAYAIMGAGANSVQWKSGASVLWRLGLDAPAGNSGANLSTAWPGYLFATDSATALSIVTTNTADVSVTYWEENG